jgi:shikimate kinase/3-dehydroquinate synthase
MVRPVVLHSCEVARAKELASALSGLTGEEVRVASDVDAVLRSRASSGVFVLPSAALLDRGSRVELLNRANVVWVKEAGIGGLQLRGEGLGEAGRARVQALLDQEYAESHLVIEPEKVGASRALEEVAALVRRGPVAVAAGERSYRVEVGRGIVESILGGREFQAPAAFYLTDENVDRLHGQRLRAAVAATGMRIEAMVLPPGEETKSLPMLGRIFDVALERGLDRSCWVMAAGGGVVTDISGLVSALWMRGLKWVGIPTTLLAMVDASVGGKTAVDHGMGKNAVGAFWQPSLVVCDVDWLVTESERNYIGALAEVVKTALIGDVGLFELLEGESERVKARDLDLLTEIVRRCVAAKARVVGLDERESGLRAVLNLGHTVGHALEALGEYKRYTHGEAVSLGLVAALRLGERLGHTPRAVAERVENLLKLLGLPSELPRGELACASELLGHDKKRAGSGLKFIFVRDVGDVRVERLVLEDLREWVAAMSR